MHRIYRIFERKGFLDSPVIGEAWARTIEQCGDTPPHFRTLTVTPGLINALWALINELRDVGATPELIRNQLAAQHPGKAEETATLLTEYERILDAYTLLDQAGLTRLATSALHAAPFDTDLRILAPKSLATRHAERGMLDIIDESILHWIDDSEPERPEIQRDVDLVAYIDTPSDAPSAVGDGSVSITGAVGERNEIRAAIRRLFNESDLQLDQVELLYTDRETYVPIIHETFAALDGCDDESSDSPVTFADGIPVSMTRPGQALAGWIAWQRSGFRQGELIRLLRAGLLSVPASLSKRRGSNRRQQNRPALSRSRLVSLMNQITIRRGRDQYVPALDQRIAAEKGRANAARGDQDGEQNTRRRRRVRSIIEQLETTRAFIHALIESTPNDDATPAEVFDHARQVLTEFVPVNSTAEGRAKRALLHALDAMRLVLERTPLQHGFDPWVWMDAMLGDVRVDATGPRPGCVHVAHVLSGGHAGRRVSIVVGMDDARVSVRLSEDPMLLDDDRHAISSALIDASTRQQQRRDAWQHALMRLRNDQIWMSYPNWDVIDQRELFPALPLLQLYRLSANDPDADLSRMVGGIPAPADCAPASAQLTPLDESEWWIRSLCGDLSVQHRPELLAEHAPALAAGQHAEQMRDDPATFSEWDGRVEIAGAALDLCREGARAVSSSTLESIARCPTDYFFKHGLRITPTEEHTVDPDRWLEPLDFGTMMHDVFRRFVQHLIDHDEHADVQRHTDLLRHMLDDEVNTWRGNVPPPTEFAYRRQRRDADDMAHVFLQEEAEYDRGVPKFVEVSCGVPLDVDAAAIATEAPVPLTLPDGRQIGLSGRIDRIDQVGDHEYHIWDYKTGRYRDVKFNAPDPFDAGRLLQHAVYMHLATTMLRKVDPEATVVGAGYIYPRVDGARREFTSATLLPALPQIIAYLADIISNGAFLPGCELRDFGISDYKNMHGDIEVAARRSEAVLTYAPSSLLDPVRALRGVSR